MTAQGVDELAGTDYMITWKTLVHMFLITGARRGEICGIKWEKIDFDSCSVKIDQSLLYSPKRGIYESTTKTGTTRVIRLPKETMQLLRQYRAWQNSKRLGHADVSTTQNIYSHLIEKADMKSAEMIADAFLRKSKQA